MKKLYKVLWDHTIEEYDVLEENDFCVVTKCTTSDIGPQVEDKNGYHYKNCLFVSVKEAQANAIKRALEDYRRAVEDANAKRRCYECLKELYKL